TPVGIQFSAASFLQLIIQIRDPIAVRKWAPYSCNNAHTVIHVVQLIRKYIQTVVLTEGNLMQKIATLKYLSVLLIVAGCGDPPTPDNPS
ncbi:MAG TPA: hypothetical protein DEP12_10280, partial [Planctomycetaceae bacterium]|nr:hypothetical protein [Planctomycetaceae bacterium]